MSRFDFTADSPSRLMVECEPEDLFCAVKDLPQWTVRALEVVGSALAYWTSNAIANPRNREGIGELRSLIRRLQVIQALERQDGALDVAGHYRQWNGMVAVLEARAHLIDRHKDTSDIEGRAHMKELRAALRAGAADDGVPTQDLQETLGLSKARLSQVLALAEAAGLIERRKQGQQKRVSATGVWLSGGQNAPQAGNDAPRKPNHLGLRVLGGALPKAA